MTLIEQIQQGEGKTLELKAQLPRHDQIAKTVVAFANTSGGKLVIGVDDERQVVGLAETDVLDLQDRVASIVFDRCSPAILPEIYSANVQGRLVLVVEVFRGNLLPYYLKAAGKNEGTYLRIGATNRRADFEHILELERQKRSQSFDEEVCREQVLSELDLTPLMERFAERGKPLTAEKLRNLKLVQMEQGELWPTQGLMILLGRYPHVVMKCARFRGTDMSVFLDRKEYEGDLFGQLAQAEGFIKNHIHLRGEISGLQRTDTYELPDEALREALVNAVVHRDYTNKGRDIKVGVYDDVVNVVSPGGLPSTLTAETLLDGRSEIRNRTIARVFKALGYIEQWGSGIQRIRAACLDWGLAEPRIREKGDFVDVEFYRPGFEVMAKPKSIGKVSGSIGRVSENEQRILAYLETQRSITSKIVENLVGVKEARARRILKEMIDKGLVEKRGGGRNTYYVGSEG
ncbi:RNA-binding domain-containing protein [Leptolyngbya sp. BC1307]|uniref:RNA-binding domain-containing protein n=1 Tax=Leptolyngbya sp. BC1307 TaxID=2029589 RepID=UPI000EFBAF7F|nr:RNA-binding domain-containing protein [Leptolyngbya sp. BC1307]